LINFVKTTINSLPLASRALINFVSGFVVFGVVFKIFSTFVSVIGNVANIFMNFAKFMFTPIGLLVGGISLLYMAWKWNWFGIKIYSKNVDLTEGILKVKEAIEKLIETFDKLQKESIDEFKKKIEEINKSEDLFIVGLVVLDGDLDGDPLSFPGYEDDFRVEGFLIFVQVLDEGRQPPLVTELPFPGNALIQQMNAHSAIQERQFSKPLGQDVETQFRFGKDERVRLEGNPSSPAGGFPRHPQGGNGIPPGIGLGIHLPVPADFHIEEFTQSVHHRHPHAMKTSRNLVGGIVEFPSCVELRHDHLDGRAILLFVDIHGDSPAVVVHGDGSVQMNLNADAVAKPCHGFVDAVVHHFIHQVMKPLGSYVSDIHGRAHANRAESLQNRNLLRRILIHYHLFSAFRIWHGEPLFLEK